MKDSIGIKNGDKRKSIPLEKFIEPQNKCGECNRCCELFPIEEIDKDGNKPCPFWDGACTIHETKPIECSDFNCAYIQAKNAPIKLRPDKCGIIFEKLSGRLFFGTLDHTREPSDMSKRQISSFIEQGYSVVLSSLSTISNQLFLAEGHDELEVQKEFTKHLERYGNL